MKKLYDKIFSTKLLKKIMTVPFFSKVLSYEILLYLFFGVMTTVFNFVVFYVSDKLLGNTHLVDFSMFGKQFSVTNEDVSTIIAWLFAVLFAYISNKLWVFESKSFKASVVLRELFSFIGARIASFLLFESLGFMLLRNVLLSSGAMSDTACKWTAKIGMAVFVTIFNYVMSKLVIFRVKHKNKNESVSEDK